MNRNSLPSANQFRISQAEHAEQHPGADPARRRLPHEPPAPARVADEDGNDDDERDEEADPQEPLEVTRLLEHVGVQDGRSLDLGQPKALGHVGVPERPGGDAEKGGER
jgi:hypothetical protein